MSNIFVLSSQYFEKVFVCGFIILRLHFFCFVAPFVCILCIFMTYSTSYCCHYKLKDPWNICIYELDKRAHGCIVKAGVCVVTPVSVQYEQTDAATHGSSVVVSILDF
jgi:hypothetical protein